MMKRVMLRLVQACMVTILLFPATGDALASPSTACKLVFRSGRTACYLSSAISAAEARFGSGAINPSSTVWKLTRLSLKQVIISGIGTGGPVEIHYLYGRLPGGATEIPIPSPAFPRYLVVEEVRGDSVPRTPVVHGATINGKVQLPWNFTGYTARRNLSILVDSNVARRRVAAVGAALLSDKTGSS